MGLFKKKLCIQRTARGVLNVVRPRPTPNTCIYDDLAFFVPSDDILRLPACRDPGTGEWAGHSNLRPQALLEII
ncbi:hypothetical protein ACS0TY_002857 [Phlomoides rotata]